MNPIPSRVFLPLTRRQVTRLALTSTATLLLMKNTAAQAPAAPPAPTSTPEGDALLAAVPANAGYALSPTQAAEVRKQLAEYPGGFAKVRAYQLPDDIGPAFAPLAPPVTVRKGRKR